MCHVDGHQLIVIVLVRVLPVTVTSLATVKFSVMSTLPVNVIFFVRSFVFSVIFPLDSAAILPATDAVRLPATATSA